MLQGGGGVGRSVCVAGVVYGMVLRNFFELQPTVVRDAAAIVIAQLASKSAILALATIAKSSNTNSPNLGLETN